MYKINGYNFIINENLKVKDKLKIDPILAKLIVDNNEDKIKINADFTIDEIIQLLKIILLPKPKNIFEKIKLFFKKLDKIYSNIDEKTFMQIITDFFYSRIIFSLTMEKKLTESSENLISQLQKLKN